ncbi:MAG: hypothetical protein PHH60_06095, partial [Candidatus Margulisbacteria bacterium]|nr:hypothetical protein [Candidatus Margulisiibacteriota bacterium]
MIKAVSILRESKVDSKGREIENRVILTPALVQNLVAQCPKVKVYVEKDAGAKIDCSDRSYEGSGAEICSHNKALQQDLILGVKETKMNDFADLQENIFMSYQHFAQSRDRTEAAVKTRAVFVALETMEKDGVFPCLAPMSEAAAKIIARHADEYALLKKKIITSGLPETGLHGAKTTILGGGSVGRTAAEEFSERGCEVYLLEKYPAR